MTLPFLLVALLSLGGGSAARAADDIPAARVVLPWSDFKTLYDKGMAPEKPPQVAPRDFAISRAVYTGRVDGEASVFDARLRVDVLKKEGWAVVPLMPTTVALRSARIGSTDAAIYLDGGWYWWITDRPGATNLDLQFAVSTWESSGQNGFAFALTPSGGTEVELSVPAEDALEFTVANAQHVVESTRGGNRVVRALLAATGNLSVSWQRAPTTESGDAAAELPLVYAEHTGLVGVAEGFLVCNSTVAYSILRAGIDELSVSLPSDVTVVDVRGPGIADWSVAAADGRNQVTVDLNFEAKGAYTLQLDYERPLADTGGAVEVPDLQVGGVERVKGWIGVDARSNVEIRGGTPENARGVDVRELPPAILGQTDFPVLLGFKHRSAEYRIPLDVRTHEDVDMLVTIVDQIVATTVMTPDGRRMTQVTYAMRNNRGQFLRLALPEGAVPWSTFVGGRAVKAARAEDGRVLIPLTRSQTSGGDLARFAVELVYVEDGEAPSTHGAGVFTARLPVADVPATAAAWTVYVPKDAKVRRRTIDGSMRQVDWFTPIQVDGTTSYEAAQQIQAQANAQFDGDAMSAGVQPVRVSLPVDGQPLYFEKLLVLGDDLEATFGWKLTR